MNKYRVFLNKTNQLCVEGNIIFDNVLKIRAAGMELMNELTTITINLSAVNYADSSALSLLATWLRAAKNQDKPIAICNLPSFLSDLGRVSGLDSILPFVRV